jgi:hypothetical protein
LGHEGFLQIGGRVRIAYHALQFTQQAIMHHAQFPADFAQPFRGGIEHLPAVRDGARYGVDQARWRRQLGGNRI